MITNLLKKLKFFKKECSICSQEQFRNILFQEITRSDRNGPAFSLVVFYLGERSLKTREQLSTVLGNRGMRIIDEAGWYTSKDIGVILHNTDQKGAMWFVQDIESKVVSKMEKSVDFDIFVYPTDREKIFYARNHERESHGKKSPVSNERRKNTRSTLFSYNKDETSAYNMKRFQELRIICNCGFPLGKRISDIIISLVCLMLVSPLFLCIAIFIKIVSPGPVFFLQERVGCWGKTFTMIKFRTMNPHQENTSIHKEYVSGLINSTKSNNVGEARPMIKLDDNRNIILFGNILRKFCIDELPQLINVLRGDMSLIGPRPPIPYEVEEYDGWHNGRLNTVPGITGLWQVSGKNRLTFDQMTRLDINYSRNRSFWMDIKIMIKTPFAILSQVREVLLRKEA